MPNAISVIAVAERGAMFDPSAVFYMQKLVVGPDCVDAIDITAPIEWNLQQIARAKGERVADLTVCILDRPRHDSLVDDVRASGARIKFIVDGDVAGAVMAAREGTGVDVLAGIGGTPEGIIAACAMSCLGGSISGVVSGPETRLSDALPSRPVMIWIGCSPRPIWSLGRTSSFAQPASRTGRSWRGFDIRAMDPRLIRSLCAARAAPFVMSAVNTASRSCRRTPPWISVVVVTDATRSAH